MKILHFERDGEVRLGLRTEGGVIDVKAASSGGVPATLEALFAAGEEGLAALRKLAAEYRGELLPEEDLRFAPAVPAPSKILCVGLNYADHAAESGMELPKTPVLFSKFPNALAAHGEEVPLPGVTDTYDYEAELVAVIGRRARNVTEEEAMDYVFGFTCGNDVSAREMQMLTSQWLLGKTFDGFAPIGPYVTTKDEVDPGNLEIRCFRNGAEVQHSNTRQLIFSVPVLVSYLSRYMTLEPGDIIFTGTPNGVVLGRPEKDWVKPGELIEVEIEGLGRLSNRMK